MSAGATLRAVGGRPGSRLESLLGRGLEPLAPLRSETGSLPLVVAAVEAPPALLEELGTDLPDGAAKAEAIAVRLRARASLSWGEPIELADPAALLEFCRERGRSSIEIGMAAPDLVPALQLGSWFDAPWRTRLGRRRVRDLPAGLAGSSARALLTAADLAFWSGARESATKEMWRGLTQSSYCALVYHRFPDRLTPGQERVAISPHRFARQLRALRAAGFSFLGEEELVGFHAGGAPVRSRGVLITVDDATADCVEPLSRAAANRPLLFAPTAEIGGSAHWLEGEPVADWEQLRALVDRGVGIGSHGRHHRRLTDVDGGAAVEELAGSKADLERELGGVVDSIAFPNGAHDLAVCSVAKEAGYRLGFTTQKGRNGGGTDPLALHRVSIHWDDGILAVLWKATTGEDLPRPWSLLRSLRACLPWRTRP